MSTTSLCLCSDDFYPGYDWGNHALGDGGSSRCQISISTYRNQDVVGRSSWLALWQAGIAINEMCVRRGYTGTSSILGTSPVDEGDPV